MRAVILGPFRAVLLLLLLLLGACSQPHDVVTVDRLPQVYPDYADVTVPMNIAPLNMLLRQDCEDMVVTASHSGMSIKGDVDGESVRFDEEEWHRLLGTAVDSEINITFTVKEDGRWTAYQPITIRVSADRVDPYLTYRLIEPDYEVFSRLQIKERCLENFTERSICDYNTVGNRCMNCHTYGANRGDLSFLYVRGEGGGMMLNRDGELRKLSLRTDDMVSGSVYAQFDPTCRYIVFSSNVIIPSFHSAASKRLEVFDTKSDVYVVDLDTEEIFTSPVFSDSLRLETFPTFSADGRSIYYCVADAPVDHRHIENTHYSLCRVDFDPSTRQIGEKADTIVRGDAERGVSVSHPRVSTDGRRLLYTVADYGTFPIWHTEADLRMLDLQTGAIDSLEVVNSVKSDTYHSWSSTGRWFVFASKRDDGLYGRPYLCHVSEDGEVSKPFVVPQLHPTHYDTCLKSYNVPELGATPVTMESAQINRKLKE